MKKTIEVINSLVRKQIIENYAMGGATALLFYTEPALTFDIDIFVLIKQKNKTALISLTPIYEALELMGYKAEKEHVIIEGIPVQFIPAYNALVEEAVTNCSKKEYEGIKVNVLTIEYLIVIMIDTNRPKDKGRVLRLIDTVPFDKNLVKDILMRHSLLNRWGKLVEEK